MNYCPYSNSECKVNVCRFWSELEGDCLVALTLEGDAEFRLEVKEAGKVGLIRVHKDLGKVLNKAMVNNLIRSLSVSDTDRDLIKKLYGEVEQRQEELDLGRLWS